MKLTREEKLYLDGILDPLRRENSVKRMRSYKQHGRISTYEHCERVAGMSLWLNRKLHLKAREKEMIRGAMLHDLYLYDWHAKDDGKHRLHGFTHPETALKNARKHFTLTPKEEDIIANHMWPLTLRHVPRSREAVIVCAADKLCSLRETIWMR